jgi:ubiquinone biosynthesis protein Coq4
MKTTIKLTNTKRMTVQPCKTGGVIVEYTNPNALFVQAAFFTLQLTPDQAGALIFALEQACEANETANQREAV